MAHVWPEVPRDRPAYAELSTDFWPWPEVLSDLAQRSRTSAALELREGQREARALWADGELLGAHVHGEDADLAQLMLAFPRATVSLFLLDASVATLAWQVRHSEGQRAQTDWQTLKSQLGSRAFSGVVRGAAGDSYWQGGARVAGPEPLPGEVVTTFTLAASAVSAGSVVEFFNEALAVADRAFGLEPHWRATALELADDHLCLDPFAREVVYEAGRLTVHGNVPTDELLPALREALERSIARAGRRPADLQLDGLRAHPLWALSGLGEA